MSTLDFSKKVLKSVEIFKNKKTDDENRTKKEIKSWIDREFCENYEENVEKIILENESIITIKNSFLKNSYLLYTSEYDLEKWIISYTEDKFKFKTTCEVTYDSTIKIDLYLNGPVNNPIVVNNTNTNTNLYIVPLFFVSTLFVGFLLQISRLS